MTGVRLLATLLTLMGAKAALAAALISAHSVAAETYFEAQ